MQVGFGEEFEATTFDQFESNNIFVCYSNFPVITLGIKYLEFPSLFRTPRSQSDCKVFLLYWNIAYKYFKRDKHGEMNIENVKHSNINSKLKT